MGTNTFEVFGRIVDKVDNFAFGVTSSNTFKVSWIFGGYSIKNGTPVANSGFVAERAATKSATFNLLDADNGFSVVQTLTVPTNLTGGTALMFQGGIGNYVLQIDGSGPNAPGSGIGLYDIRISAVPLPASGLLLLGGFAVMAMRRKK